MDMGRPRTRSRAGWPDNLYPNRNGYKYLHPVTRRETWMGTDRARAFAAAKKLNAMLSAAVDLVAKVAGSSKTVADAITVFRRDDIPGRDWAPKTAEVYESILRRTQQALGARELGSMSVRDCAEFQRNITESPRARQQFRLVLGWILACAVEEGWIDSNPALLTRKATYKRARERLTIDVYTAIWEKASPWLRNAMDLSLITLLRREDVASARFADIRDDALWIVPAKTESTSSVRLKIRLTPALSELVSRCRDDVLSPYLIHRLPEKARPTQLRAEARRHHTQVLPEQLSRAFADARDAAGITSANPPTFHEIRSLGGALLREQGWTTAQVQALMGHSTQAMTEIYLGGHEAPWTEVAPGLTLRR